MQKSALSGFVLLFFLSLFLVIPIVFSQVLQFGAAPSALTLLQPNGAPPTKDPHIFMCDPILIKWIPSTDADTPQEQLYYKLEYSKDAGTTWSSITDGFRPASEFNKSIGASLSNITRRSNITSLPTERIEKSPFISPTAQRIAFTTVEGDPPASDVEQLNFIPDDGLIYNEIQYVQVFASSNNPYAKRGNFFPAYSPNGTKIVFVFAGISQATPGIYILNNVNTSTGLPPDQTPTRIYTLETQTNYVKYAYLPKFNPPIPSITQLQSGGEKILFVKNRCLRPNNSESYSGTQSPLCEGIYPHVKRNYDIFLMNSDGSNPVNLTNTLDTYESYPFFLPDGKILYFSEEAGSEAMWVMEVNYATNARISKTKISSSLPDWFTGNPIYPLFLPSYGFLPQNNGAGSSVSAGASMHIYPGGTKFQTVSMQYDASRDPLKQKIYFSSDLQGFCEGHCLWRMNADGSELEQLTYFDYSDTSGVGIRNYAFGATASNDGKRIIFTYSKCTETNCANEAIETQNSEALRDIHVWDLWVLQGDVLSYLWDTHKSGVPNGTQYKVKVTVSDDQGQTAGLSDASEYNFTISCSNWPPMAEAGGPYTGFKDAPITLNGTATDIEDEPDRAVSDLVWSIDPTYTDCSFPSNQTPFKTGLGTSNALNTASITCTNTGTKTVILTATDNGIPPTGISQKTHSDTAVVNVSELPDASKVGLGIASMKAEPFIIQVGSTGAVINAEVRNFSAFPIPVTMGLSTDNQTITSLNALAGTPQTQTIDAHGTKVFSFPQAAFSSLPSGTYLVKATATTSLVSGVKPSYASATFTVIQPSQSSVPELSMFFVPLIIGAVLFIALVLKK